MRKVIYSIAMMLMLALVSCQQDVEDLGKGYLELSSVDLQGVTIESVSRADADEYVVEIWSDTERVMRFTMDGAYDRITLDAGTYTLKVFTPSYEETYHNRQRDDAKYYGEPQYFIEDQIEIKANEVLNKTYSLPMINSKVTFEMFDGYEEIFPTAYLIIDDRQLSPGESAYVASGDERYTVSATNTDDEYNSNSETITLEPGKEYIITFELSK